MTDRLLAVAMVAAAIGVSYPLCMRAAPHRGVMRVVERMCAGIILCYLCWLGLSPLGLSFPQGPLSAASAGLPGASWAGAGGVCLLAALKVDNLGALQRGSDQRVAVQLAFAVEK